MAKRNHITESNPRTGASSIEQTAQNFNGSPSQTGTMMDNDKLIYELVQSNVEFCGEQLNENLRFNSVVLTNVLYDNIYKLLGDKFNADDFVEWVAQELIDRGCVIQTISSDADESKQEDQSEEVQVVTELDITAYDDLKQKVYASIELIQANKLTIFKILSDVDGKIKSIDDTREKTSSINVELLHKRDEYIRKLVDRIQGNQDTVHDFISQQDSGRPQVDVLIQQVTSLSEEKKESSNQDSIFNDKDYQSIQDYLDVLEQTIIQKNKQRIDGEDSEFKEKQSLDEQNEEIEIKQEQDSIDEVINSSEIEIKQEQDSIDEVINSSEIEKNDQQKQEHEQQDEEQPQDKQNHVDDNSKQKDDESETKLVPESKQEIQDTLINSTDVVPSTTDTSVSESESYSKQINETEVEPTSINQRITYSSDDKPDKNEKQKSFSITRSIIDKIINTINVIKNRRDESNNTKIVDNSISKKQIYLQKKHSSVQMNGILQKSVKQQNGGARAKEVISGLSKVKKLGEQHTLSKRNGLSKNTTQLGNGFGESHVIQTSNLGRSKIKQNSTILGTHDIDPFKPDETKLNKKKGIINGILFKIQSKIGKVKTNVKSKFASIKQRISKSFIGKTWRGIKKVAKAAVSTVKGIGRGIKFSAKLFLKTSKVIGSGIQKAGIGWFNLGKKIVDGIQKDNGKALIRAAMEWSPAQTITKIVFGGLKMLGKVVWKGVKKIGKSMLNMLKKVFKFGGKLFNKMSYYIAKLGQGIKNVAMRFIVKPISSIVLTVVKMVHQIITGTANFMKSTITGILENVYDVMSNIRQGVSMVMQSTMSFIKNIIFNPITIAFIIGTIFYFFGPKLLSILSGGVQGIREKIIPAIVSFSTTVFQLLKGAYDVISYVGAELFNAIEWITNPDGYLAKFIVWIIKAVKAGKNLIYTLMKAAGKSTIDTFCMFISGDLIGLALHSCIGAIKWFWKWFCRLPLGKLIIGLVNTIVKFGELIFKWHLMAFQALKGFVTEIITGNYNTAIKALLKPYQDWWNGVKAIWSGQKPSEVIVEDPVAQQSEKMDNVKTSVGNFHMYGMNTQKVTEKLDSMLQLKGFQAGKGVVQRIDSMSNLYQVNSKQVQEYENFISDMWKLGKGNPEIAQKTLKSALESPDISQRLLSAFYYYNPQTGEVMSLFPPFYIKGVINNIQTLVTNPDSEPKGWDERFKLVIEAFDQANKERANIVNKQGDVIIKFSNDIKNLDLSNQNANVKLSELANKLNSDKMFNSIPLGELAFQITNKKASTKQIESVTGDELGTNNILRLPGEDVSLMENYGNDMFVVPNTKKAEKSNVTLPKELQVKPSSQEINFEENKNKLDEMWRTWNEHQQKRIDLSAKGVGDEELSRRGLDNYTWEEWKKKYEKENPPDVKKVAQETEYENDRKRQALSGLRLTSDIQAYNNQGTIASANGFVLGKTPSILQIEADGLSQNLLMFSPEWQKVQGASTLSDDELLGMISEHDEKALDELKRAREARIQKQKEKEEFEQRQRQREQEILDYSAKVEGGFIEVKVGEDVTAMREAWEIHQQKRIDLSAQGVGDEELDKMGLKNYTWDEWKVYYRKMHGLPEDGIKRIPFEGKRKEREIDWSPRKSLSSDELSKYGVSMSEDGPIMIPLAKAMEISNALIQQAKTVLSIRDGLQVMKEGLDNESEELRKRREGGMPISVVQIPNNSTPNTMSAPERETPKNQSQTS